MNDIYENPKILDEYLLFHYGSQDDILDPGIQWSEGMVEALNFAKRTPSHFARNQVSRGLDLGCAVGGSAFEMSRHCDQVIGIDFSQGFIDAANHLKSEGRIRYSRLDEGSLSTELVATLPEEMKPSHIEFQQGDAMRLPEELGNFDRVHAANLLCRLTEPLLLLDRLPELVKPGGELILATPCTWLETFTPCGNWPDADTFTWLKKHLSGSFELREECDEPFLIRETARKFQWTRSMLTVWDRKTEAG
jgi:putative 4-mercaptohistidine N1-methyltranferase